MSTQYQLRPVELCDLPTLKRWRGLPSVQAHLRHPHLTWFQHLQWWWRTKHDPTCRIWAVVDRTGALVGQAGLYYRMGPAAEVSIVMIQRGLWRHDVQWYDVEDFAAEWDVVQGPLAREAKAWGVTVLWAEVLATAPLHRHNVFPRRVIWADSYSTIYRWRIA